MRVLFVTSFPYAIEPLGVMTLLAICKRAGHTTRLAILKKDCLERLVSEFRPDVVAYSTATSDVDTFQAADEHLRANMPRHGKRPFRVMGGPHPTYTPSVLDEFELDAICQGDGDHALPELLRRIETGAHLDDVPNIALTSQGAGSKELVDDLDSLPFPDRTTYYEKVPYCRSSGMRSVLTGRGCPYTCSYCFNSAYRKLFQGCGPIIRRRSVENVLAELEYLKREFPPVRLVRFSDDTFAYRVDPWLEEFCEKYPARIDVPFYCLMRPDTLTEDVARLLAGAGCRAVGMSIEAGSERLRNEVLERRISDETIRHSFEMARRHGLRTYASAMVGIPGGKIEDDYCSLDLARSIRPSAQVFPICTPYRGTRLWEAAVQKGYLDPAVDPRNMLGQKSPLQCFTEREKATQLRLCYLGPMYCHAPRPLAALVRAAIKLPVPHSIAHLAGATYMAYRIATRIFPEAIPRTPGAILRIVVDTIRYLS
jgi:anaerobic magnesium-protoporphyrin IX monomethyl ester cyclase